MQAGEGGGLQVASQRQLAMLPAHRINAPSRLPGLPAPCTAHSAPPAGHRLPTPDVHPPNPPLPQERYELGYSDAVDVWAVGVLAYELLVGRPPFERESREETYAYISGKEPQLPGWLSDGARAFIAAALAKVGGVGSCWDGADEGLLVGAVGLAPAPTHALPPAFTPPAERQEAAYHG